MYCICVAISCATQPNSRSGVAQLRKWGMTSMDGMAGGYGLARRGPSLLLRRRSKDLTKGPAKDWSPRLTTEVRA